MVQSKRKNTSRKMIRTKTRNNKRLGSRNRSSVRGRQAINNSATRHRHSTKKKQMKGRLHNTKKGTNNNQQKKKMKTTSIGSLISSTTTNFLRPNEEFHREQMHE